MRVRYLVAAGAAVAAALLAVSPAAAKQEPYPPAAPLLSVSASTVVVGESVVLTGTGFGANEQVQITTSVAPFAAPQVGVDESTQEQVSMVPVAHSQPMASSGMRMYPTATTDSAGYFTTTVTLHEVGMATITATGHSSGLSASVVVTVLSERHALPLTGGDAWGLLRIGGAAVLVGGILLLTALVWRSRTGRTRENA